MTLSHFGASGCFLAGNLSYYLSSRQQNNAQTNAKEVTISIKKKEWLRWRKFGTDQIAID